MKNDTHKLKDEIKALRDALIVLHDAQEATMAWLTNIGQPMSAQLAFELKEQISFVKASREKVARLLDGE
jgi:CHAD domain-containing protein